jgi:hypothetical protein
LYISDRKTIQFICNKAVVPLHTIMFFTPYSDRDIYRECKFCVQPKHEGMLTHRIIIDIIQFQRNGFNKRPINCLKEWKSIFFRWLYSPVGPWPLIFSFIIILQTVGLLGRVISSSQGFYLNIGQHKHRINTYTYQTSLPYVGFEPTIPASEPAKIVHSLNRSATVTGWKSIYIT